MLYTFILLLLAGVYTGINFCARQGETLQQRRWNLARETSQILPNRSRVRYTRFGPQIYETWGIRPP